MGNNLFLMRTISISNNDFDDICSLESGFFEGRKDEYRRWFIPEKVKEYIMDTHWVKKLQKDGNEVVLKYYRLKGFFMHDFANNCIINIYIKK